MQIYNSQKTFLLWDYVISHQKLLLRSNEIDIDNFTNIDIIFWGTSYVNIPTILDGIKLSEIESTAKKSRLKENKNDKIFHILSNENIYVIEASACYIYYNNLEFDISSVRDIVQHSVLIASST